MGDLDRALGEIRRRDWDKMRPKWIAEIARIPNVSDPPEQTLNKINEIVTAHDMLRKQRAIVERQFRDAIETYVCEQKQQAAEINPAPTEVQLKEARNKFTENKKRELFVQLAPLRYEVPGIWAIMFSEALRLLDKALHVLGCAEIDADLGMRSWSLCSGYQAALFAGKSLLALCGIGIAEVGSKTLIIDAFPGPVKQPDDYTDCSISFISSQLNHLDTWNLIQRVLGLRELRLLGLYFTL